jgi:hypothetical protein
MISKRIGDFVTVASVIEAFCKAGCVLGVVEADVIGDDGDTFNFRMLRNPANGGEVPLVDLHDNDSITIEEIEAFERRLGIAIL